MNVLMTGIGGFVGSHCLDHFLKNTDWNIIGLDSFRHKGTCLRVMENVPKGYEDRVKIFRHDLAVPIDPQLENLLLQQGKIDLIINLASESAVERSTVDPVSCLRNNYDLMINMLEFARRIEPTLFIQFSTDEVYGEASPSESHKEWSTIMPSNPYSASKAAQEALAISYWRTYNMPIIITNGMNIIGERQDPEKFLPKIIQCVANGVSVPIYGDSLQSIGSRTYIHGYNVGDALVFLANKKPALYEQFVATGETYLARLDRYNICGDIELNNLELAQMVADIMGKKLEYHIVPSESARKGYDRRYALDGSKIHDLGWSQVITLQESLERIVRWSLANPHWLV